jgi:hypothetical protein
MKSLSNHLLNQPLSRYDEKARPEQQNFPLTDYQYQATTQEKPASSVASPARARHATELRSFRQLSDQFSNAEANREFAAEATLLAFIAAVAAWPIISMLIVLAQTAHG